MSRIINQPKFALSVFFIALFSGFTLGQNNNLQKDLNDSFMKFSLVRLNNQNALRKVNSGDSLILPVGEKSYELNLVPNDIRSARYAAENSTVDGVERLEKGAVTTFKGKINGDYASKVRLTIDGAKIEGFFETGGEKYIVEPAKNYSKYAAADESIVYRAEDLLKKNEFACDSEVEGKIRRGEQLVGAPGFNALQQTRILEIATEADYSFVNQMGGAVQANNEILSILNMVEGIYEGNLDLSIRVVFQHTWTTADPFNAANTTTLLTSIKDFWNANYPQTVVARSETHLFSGRFAGQGLSYVGTVCANPNFAYGSNGWIGSAAANALLTSHEIGHTLGGRHVGVTENCDSTIMNPYLSETTPMVFCTASRSEIGNYVSVNSGCLSHQSTSVGNDFDADGKADIALFRPSNGVWCIAKSANSSFDFTNFGQAGDKIVPADYDGDGKTDIAVYRAGVWYRLKSSTGAFDAVNFGIATDIPAPADYDGDGKADIAVFRPSEGIWHRLLSNGGTYSPVQFGMSGDVPTPADYDGDGKADINVFRPSNGVWYRSNSGNNSFYAVQFGQAGDKPLVGDYDGDGKADIAVFRPSIGAWYRLNGSNNSFSATSFGIATDVPTPADYDGDGTTDISVYRPSEGVWYRFNSSNNSFVAFQFGIGEDIPTSAPLL